MMTKECKKYEEDGVNLASKVPAALAEEFRSQTKRRGQQVKYNLAAAVRLWVSLPEGIQAQILNRENSDETFQEVVRSIVAEMMMDWLHNLPSKDRQTIEDYAHKAQSKIQRQNQNSTSVPPKKK